MMQTLKTSMSLVVESLIKNFEEDQRQKEVLVQEKQRAQSSSQFNYDDACSDSDSSFNQVKFAPLVQLITSLSMTELLLLLCLLLQSYTFIRQEQVQALAEQLDPSWPKQVKQPSPLPFPRFLASFCSAAVSNCPLGSS